MKPSEFKENREFLGMTQSQLADEMGVNISSLRRWETDPSKKSSRIPNKFAVEKLERLVLGKKRKDARAAK